MSNHAPKYDLARLQAANKRHRTVNMSLASVAQAVRRYQPEARQAALWLANLAANSQRIQFCWQDRHLQDPLGTIGRINEADLAEALHLEPEEIYSALTDHEDANLPKFTAAVKAFRERFESCLPPLVNTGDTKIISEAFLMASEDHRLCTVEGKWRHGKTEEMQRKWLLNLHRCIWVHSPDDNSEIAMYAALAETLGISVGQKKVHVLRDQCAKALAIGLIDTIIWEEAHNLWPNDIVNGRPTRLEYVRRLRDHYGIGQIFVSTDQFALNLALAMKHNELWAPGQLSGRRYYFRLRDRHTEKEIIAIAKLHGGEHLPEEALLPLANFALGEEGYLGSMVNTIRMSIRKAKADNRTVCTMTDIAAAMQQQQKDERVEQIADSMKPSFRTHRSGSAARRLRRSK